MDNYNGFPATYQQAFQPNWYYSPSTTQPVFQPRYNTATTLPPYQQNQNMQQVPANNGMIWVQGESGAKSYVLPNGTTLPLWDSEAQVIYIKSVDNQGRPSMTILDYTERGAKEETKAEEPKIEYATKEQVESLNGQFTAINDKLNALGKYVTKDQFDSLNGHLNDLSGQIEDIENRLTGFGKSQQTQNNRRNK